MKITKKILTLPLSSPSRLNPSIIPQTGHPISAAVIVKHTRHKTNRISHFEGPNWLLCVFSWFFFSNDIFSASFLHQLLWESPKKKLKRNLPGCVASFEIRNNVFTALPAPVEEVSLSLPHHCITVFENHRKSLIEHCERSELLLHFEGTIDN